MPAHKLVLDEVFEQPYKLLAIHSSVEEYKLAYLLNKHLNLKLARTPKDIDLHKGTENAFFAHFVYEDLQQYCTYHLVSNVARQEEESWCWWRFSFFLENIWLSKNHSYYRNLSR